MGRVSTFFRVCRVKNGYIQIICPVNLRQISVHNLNEGKGDGSAVNKLCVRGQTDRYVEMQACFNILTEDGETVKRVGVYLFKLHDQSTVPFKLLYMLKVLSI